MPRNQHTEDPAEGSREIIDRELRRSDEQKRSESGKKGKGEQQSHDGGKAGGVGGEEGGRD